MNPALVLAASGRAERRALPAYKVLIFRAARLERHEDLEADSDLAALEKAAAIKKTANVELWRGDRRLAIFRPAKAK